MMLTEVILGAVISSILGAAGGASLSNLKLRDRLSAVELKMAEQYVPKADLNTLISRMEDHLVRIENKFDEFLKAQR